jgi:hypothetical protein
MVGAATMTYLIGSLRNPKIPFIANSLRKANIECFDDWYAAGPEADDKWRDYEKLRGHNFREALAGFAAQHVFALDRYHLGRCDVAVLILPAGKSGHLELGFALGQGKRGYILLEHEDPERFDVMYNFATGIVASVDDLIKEIKHGES